MGGYAIADTTADLTKIAVIERHLATGRVGLGKVAHAGGVDLPLRLDAHPVLHVLPEPQQMPPLVALLFKLTKSSQTKPRPNKDSVFTRAHLDTVLLL